MVGGGKDREEMKEILFKAKRIDNGEWVYGFYMDRKGPEIIQDGTWIIWEVDENTVCQYTGLTDKNGNKIWENDVVRLPELFGSEIGQVVYLAPSFKSYCKAYGYTQLCGEVIGNAFDNADLLKGE